MSNYCFDFPYTCPDIDRAIESTEEELCTFVDEIDNIKDSEDFKKKANTLIDSTLATLKELYEDIRKQNWDIREAATKQISNLLEENRELENSLDNSINEVDDLRGEVNELKDRIKDLEIENDNLSEKITELEESI